MKIVVSVVLVAVVMVVRAQDDPLAGFIAGVEDILVNPYTAAFSCEGQLNFGYFGDVESDCQVKHYVLTITLYV